MNPLGNIPVYLAALRHVSPKRRTRIIIREALFAFVILCAFLVGGHRILQALQVSESALGIAGGLLLFLIAIRLIFPAYDHEEQQANREPFLVPLAIPLFAGPATMTTVMLLVDQAKYSTFKIFIALTIAWIVSSSILLASSRISKFMGDRGLTALERLMGMVLTAIAVQMLLTGIKAYFQL